MATVSEGRKIPKMYENCIDNFIIDIGVKLNPLFKKLNLTPNDLTTVSAIFGLLSVYLVYQGNYILASVCFFISYCFDCFDGNYARVYNMVTKFGDFYDHIKDYVIFILLYIVIMFKCSLKKKVIVTVLFVLFGFLMSVHLGCQERYYSKNTAKDESEILNFTRHFSKKVCNKSNNYHDMVYTKWVGCGMYTLIIILIILSLKK